MKRVLTAVLFLAATACTQEAGLPLTAEDLTETAWRGNLEANSYGELEMTITEVEPGWFEGEVWYESLEGPNQGARSLTRMEGPLIGDRIVLDEVEMPYADQLSRGWIWCTGEFEMSKDEFGLSGSWLAHDCMDDGTVELDAG